MECFFNLFNQNSWAIPKNKHKGEPLLLHSELQSELSYFNLYINSTSLYKCIRFMDYIMGT